MQKMSKFLYIHNLGYVQILLINPVSLISCESSILQGQCYVSLYTKHILYGCKMRKLWLKLIYAGKKAQGYTMKQKCPAPRRWETACPVKWLFTL